MKSFPVAFNLCFALLLMGDVLFGQHADTQPQWYEQLPDCPCKDPDYNGIQLNDGWAKDRGDLNKYHKGAASSYRSYPPVITEAGKSCQQCCYDANGDLITSGSGAGTPDKVSTCSGENEKGEMTLRWVGLAGHYFKDVKPWQRYMKADSAGWQVYNRYWIPNTGKACKENTVSP